MGISSDSTGREFGHSIVNWEIKNYELIAWKQKSEIETPKFIVHGPGSLKTSWKLILEHDLNPGENESNVSEIKRRPEFQDSNVEEGKPKIGRFVFHLLRCDSGMESVWVDWRVKSSHARNLEPLVVEGGEKDFGNSTKRTVDLGIIYKFREDLMREETLFFTCQWIVYMKSRFSSFDSFVDTNLGNFSMDFDLMLKSDHRDKFYDLEVKFGEKSIRTHAAILASRSKTFDSLLEVSTKDLKKEFAGFVDTMLNGVGHYPSNKLPPSIDLPVANYDGMLELLDYLYSGKLTNIITKPSLTAYDSIIYMKLKDLEEYYAPDEVTINSTIDARELTCIWLISDFSKKDDYLLTSCTFQNEEIEGVWRITVYPRGIIGESENVSISVEKVEGMIWDDMLVQCSVLTETETSRLWKDLKRCVRAEKFVLENFMRRETLIETLDNDLLKLSLNIKAFVGKKDKILGESTKLGVGYSKMKPLEKLQKDMLSLRKTNIYYDIVLKVGKENITAHKGILAARSKVLFHILEELDGDFLDLANIVALSKITPEIFGIVMHYMYCAILSECEVNTLLHVYEAADKLAISSLREECSRVLQDMMTLETAVRLLDFAEEHYDAAMERMALDFIQKNFSKVSESESWKDLCKNKPNLCKKIPGKTKSPKVPETMKYGTVRIM